MTRLWHTDILTLAHTQIFVANQFNRNIHQVAQTLITNEIFINGISSTYTHTQCVHMRPDVCCMLLLSFFSFETHSAHFPTDSHPLYLYFARYLSFGLYSDTNNFNDSSFVAAVGFQKEKTFDSIFLERGVSVSVYVNIIVRLQSEMIDFFVWVRVHD